MRNQGWTQDGELIKDDELYLDEGVLKVLDHIIGEVRDPTEAEIAQFFPEPELGDLQAQIDEIKDKMIVSMPEAGEVKITNLTYNPTTKEIKHREAP